jgi:hypothetical protein
VKVPPKLRRDWRTFTRAVESRLEAGAREYGDASLRAAPARLAGEIDEELLDVMGWGFLLWRRVRALDARRARPRRRTR